MADSSTFLVAIAELASIESPAERRLVWRQGFAALANAAVREPAPLEGLSPSALLASVKVAIADGLVHEISWLSPAAAAVAAYALAHALPSGPERRELGRRTLARLQGGDRETFISLATAMALSSPRALDNRAVRARLEVALAAPLNAPGGLGALALALLGRDELAQSWLGKPATGSLPDRRRAARLLAHAARAAVERAEAGDDDSLAIFATPVVAAASTRLLADREALVWRFAAIARGLIAHRRPDGATEIDQDLAAPNLDDRLRRAATSAAAALERGGFAQRWRPVMLARSQQAGPGISRSIIQGLAGLATVDPPSADQLAAQLVLWGELEGIEALVDLRIEEGDLQLPDAIALALGWLDRSLSTDDGTDDGRRALLQTLRAELTGNGAPDAGSVAASVEQVRAALNSGDLSLAIKRARVGLEELEASIDWLERAQADDAVDRRHGIRLVRELEYALLIDGTLSSVIALAADGGGAPPPTSNPGGGTGPNPIIGAETPAATMTALLTRLERALIERESAVETASAVPHYRLRIMQLRALVRLLDSESPLGDDDGRLTARLASTRVLMARARDERSPLRRAVWAALTRAWDALIRDNDAELSDLLLCMTSSFDADEDFGIVREATMAPAVEAVVDAYVKLTQSTWAAADPDDTVAIKNAVDRLMDLGRAFPRGTSPRVESVRNVLMRIARQLNTLVAINGLSTLNIVALDELADEVGTLAQRQIGARRQLGMPIALLANLDPDKPNLGPGDAMHAAARAIERSQRGAASSSDTEIAIAIEACRDSLPPSVGAIVGRVLTRIARLPEIGTVEVVAAVRAEAALPQWLPLSRNIGGFYVVRSIGHGAGGSVFVACRSDERHNPDAMQVALKVPDYDGGAARSLSEHEFEAMFREEAGALLSLPSHPNLSGFITFDAGARPKPILVMELVRGPTLERALDVASFNATSAFAVIDGIAAGLEAMHAARVAHLDIKPPNVILRDANNSTQGDRARLHPVLVDFGLAGRKVRPGCGSPHYGAPEVWTEKGKPPEPYATDVYALSCLAFEILTRQPLVDSATLGAVLTLHRTGQAATRARNFFPRHPALSRLAEVIAMGVHVDPAQRPTVGRLRAAFAALAPELIPLGWPLAT